MPKQGPRPLRTQVLVDCDGVLADFVSAVAKLGKEIGVFVPEPKEHDYLNCLFKNGRSPVLDHMGRPGWAQSFEVLDGARALVESLKDMGMDVNIVTSPWDSGPTWDFDRKQWIKTHLGLDKYKVIFAKQKWLIGGLTLIEDNAENANWWTEQWGKSAILIDKPWNVDEIVDDRVIRVVTLEEAVVAVRSLQCLELSSL